MKNLVVSIYYKMRKVFYAGCLVAVSVPVAGLITERLYPRIRGSVSGSNSLDQISHHGADHMTTGIKGGYPCSYYAAVVKEPFIERESINQDLETDVCVIGAGLTGVSTALNLSEHGKKVIVLESKRVSWNASGRNGGFAIPGFAVPPIEMEEKYGTNIAKKYYKMTLDGSNNVKRQIEQYNIQCDFQDKGYLELSSYKESDFDEDMDTINKRLGTSLEFWDKEKTRKYYKTDFYHWGVLDKDSFIVNPLGLTLGIARAAELNGTKIFEDSPAIKIENCSVKPSSKTKFIVHAKGKDDKPYQISCNNVVLAGSCHIDSSLNWKLSRGTSPLFTYIGVTKPLSREVLDKIISEDALFSVADDTTEINYFRITPDNRLLWGTFAQSFERNHSHLKKDIHSVITNVFPIIKDDIETEYVWGGDIAMTHHMIPLIGKVQPGYYYATGFGGHGVIPTNTAGMMVSNAIISGDDTEIDNFQKLFPMTYVGWPMDRFFVQSYILYEKIIEIITKMFE